jgi:hypothetical protein
MIFKPIKPTKSRRINPDDIDNKPTEDLEVLQGLMLGIYRIDMSMTWRYTSKPGWPTGDNAGLLSGPPSLLKIQDGGPDD